LSRVLVHGADNLGAGEFKATVNRGWSLAGVSSQSGGGSTVLTLPIEAAVEKWLQLGSLVYIDHAVLGPWVGIIDTPWKANAPIQVSAYDPAYLLALRVLDDPVTLSGDVAEIVGELINLVNAQEELYLRLGSTEGSSTVPWTKTFDQTPMWNQLNALGMETGTEVRIRPEREEGQLVIYVDLSPQFGLDTSFLLYDGDEGNMRITEAKLEGKIRNRVIGISNQGTAQDRLQSGPETDDESIALYRLRSWVEQFSGVDELGILEENARLFLAGNARPRLKLTAEIYEAAFPYLALGNLLSVQASKLYLPGGRQGWSGDMRLMAMFYEEARNIVTVNVEAFL